MPFRFPLQAVLRFRQSFERRERQRLQVITREVVKVGGEYADAKQERAAALEGLEKGLREGMTAAELRFELECDRERLRRVAGLAEQVVKLEELRVRQLGEFRKAQQRRKILESLRDHQLAAYHVVQERRAQQQLDERFIILHGGRGSG